MAKIDESSVHQEQITLLNAVLADYTAIRAEVVKLVTDITALRTSYNTLVTKMNADAGITDTNYAAPAAITAAAPAAPTVTVS